MFNNLDGELTVFRSYTPAGRLWCETQDPNFFLVRNAEWKGSEPLTSEKTVSSRNFNLVRN